MKNLLDLAWVIVDLEATCWKDQFRRTDMETIEIGAVKFDPMASVVVAEFDELIKPKLRPQLSDFCQTLTTITQSMVDGAENFPAAFGHFEEWLGGESIVFGSWSDYDDHQLRQDCRLHGLSFPDVLSNHVDLRKLFNERLRTQAETTNEALESLGLTIEGTLHRGIDDSRNIARLCNYIAEDLKNDLVYLEPYNSGWVDIFEEEKQRIESKLGKGFCRIEHVGSTAVSGLPSKPIIDIMIGVESNAQKSMVRDVLKDMNYTFYGEYGLQGRDFYRKNCPATHHMHVVQYNGAFWRDLLEFRGRLQRSEDKAKEYAALKLESAGKYGSDRKKYTESKTGFVVDLLKD